MKALLQRADERAFSCLSERRDVLDRLADILLEREILAGSELARLLGDAEVAAEPAHR
jgi:ATP-dependent Zn protease